MLGTSGDRIPTRGVKGVSGEKGTDGEESGDERKNERAVTGFPDTG